MFQRESLTVWQSARENIETLEPLSNEILLDITRNFLHPVNAIHKGFNSSSSKEIPFLLVILPQHLSGAKKKTRAIPYLVDRLAFDGPPHKASEYLYTMVFAIDAIYRGISAFCRELWEEEESF
ncbi:hypothetical protein CEXT_8031 [Caerostris extrusa]|uniref:Uncharacterized protein n=1 Tax=Caerostris extrusa TaxID=172846 RepID=A0AAV4VH19_CAEEX|nr:hypothetical protein CEXT_8031 [Caerostris extrusa]